MMRGWWILWATLFGASLWFWAAYAAHAQTQPQCGPRAAVVKTLADKYSETRRSIGVSGNNLVMEVYASDASGTWTITITHPDGMTCLVASGQGYETVVEDLPPAGTVN